MKKIIYAYDRKNTRFYIKDLAYRAVVGLVLLVPYRLRVPLFGWLLTWVLAPLVRIKPRIRANLRFAYRDIDEADQTRIANQACDNFGRLLIENLSARDFVRHARDTAMTGPGVGTLKAALDNGKPVILVSGHFGNFQVGRTCLEQMGHPVASIYRPLNNGYTNVRYRDNLDLISGPNFPRGMKGTRDALRHIKSGGILALLIDQYSDEGEVLRFFDRPTRTVTSAADFSLRFDALLVPVFGVRRSDGRSFDLVVDEPIVHSDAATMIQTFNDRLEAQIRLHPGQWFWLHQRWKDTIGN